VTILVQYEIGDRRKIWFWHPGTRKDAADKAKEKLPVLRDSFNRRLHKDDWLKAEEIRVYVDGERVEI